jgi:hypothetical protein
MLKEVKTQLKIGPTHDQIAALAYEYWEKSSRQPGHAEEHWLKAEAKLRAASRLPDSRGTLTVSNSNLGRGGNGSRRRELAPR